MHLPLSQASDYPIHARRWVVDSRLVWRLSVSGRRRPQPDLVVSGCWCRCRPPPATIAPTRLRGSTSCANRRTGGDCDSEDDDVPSASSGPPDRSASCRVEPRRGTRRRRGRRESSSLTERRARVSAWIAMRSRDSGALTHSSTQSKSVRRPAETPRTPSIAGRNRCSTSSASWRCALRGEALARSRQRKRLGVLAARAWASTFYARYMKLTVTPRRWVAFIGSIGSDGIRRLRGTGFFVGVPAAAVGQVHVYVATRRSRDAIRRRSLHPARRFSFSLHHDKPLRKIFSGKALWVVGLRCRPPTLDHQHHAAGLPRRGRRTVGNEPVV